jgi:hypothetical protein
MFTFSLLMCVEIIVLSSGTLSRSRELGLPKFGTVLGQRASRGTAVGGSFAFHIPSLCNQVSAAATMRWVGLRVNHVGHSQSQSYSIFSLCSSSASRATVLCLVP